MRRIINWIKRFLRNDRDVTCPGCGKVCINTWPEVGYYVCPDGCESPTGSF